MCLSSNLTGWLSLCTLSVWHRAAASDGSPPWLLMWLKFLDGVFQTNCAIRRKLVFHSTPRRGAAINSCSAARIHTHSYPTQHTNTGRHSYLILWVFLSPTLSLIRDRPGREPPSPLFHICSGKDPSWWRTCCSSLARRRTVHLDDERGKHRFRFIDRTHQMKQFYL